MQCIAGPSLQAPFFDSAANPPFCPRLTVEIPWTRWSGDSSSSPRHSTASISLQQCLDMIGTLPDKSIAVFITETSDKSTLDSYKSRLLELNSALQQSDIVTFESVFGTEWAGYHAPEVLPTNSWIPQARCYSALASRVMGDIDVLMPFRRKIHNPYQDGRANPWTSYVYPILTRNPLVSSINIVDLSDFSRTRIAWRKGDKPWGKPPYLGEMDLDANMTSPDYVEKMIHHGVSINSASHPTVFWSSICEDSRECLDRSEAVVNNFINTHLSGNAVHWFNMQYFWGSKIWSMHPSLLPTYLSIDEGSPCYHEPGSIAVLEADAAQGIAYVILSKHVELERPNHGLKKRCWWCECELPVLTRNDKISRIVRVDAEDLSQMRTTWKRGDVPIGRSPYQ